jgi:hypothetical protein
MSKLQNDFTTKQQSEKLLALGMPRLSANFYYDDENEVQIVRDPEFELQSKGYFPCWSVGMLMKIFAICFDPDFIHFDTYADGINFLQQMMEKFETYAENMGFSKLEERV